MKNAKLENCLNLLSKADVVIISKDHLSFNQVIKTNAFRKELERLCELAFNEHLKNLGKIKGDSPHYLFCLQGELNDLHRNYYDQNDRILHKKLKVKDYNDLPLNFEDLPVHTQEKISNYIIIQKAVLNSLSKKLNYNNRQIVNNHIKWLGSKTELIELSIALYEGGYVGLDNGKLSKTEFMSHMSSICGIDIENYNSTQTKITNRENRAPFLDALKTMIDRIIQDSIK